MLFGNPETTSGGNALKYYASMRLDIRARDKITEAGKPEPVGNKVRVKVVKNKVGDIGADATGNSTHCSPTKYQASCCQACHIAMPVVIPS